MKKAVVVFAAAALSMTAVCSPESAEARRGWGWGPVAGGLLAGAVIGGLASSAYGYGPGYGYYGPGYGGYAYDRYGPGGYGYAGQGYRRYGYGGYGYGAYGSSPYYGGPAYYGYAPGW